MATRVPPEIGPVDGEIPDTEFCCVGSGVTTGGDGGNTLKM